MKCSAYSCIMYGIHFRLFLNLIVIRDSNNASRLIFFREFPSVAEIYKEKYCS